MKTLVVYDSAYGNTAKIAEAIYGAVKTFGEADIVLADKFRLQSIDNVNVMFIGTPTQGGKPTAAIQKIIKDLSGRDMKNMRIAPFDTRFATETHGKGLKLVMKIIGFASPKIYKTLKNAHIGTVEKAEGFIVKDTEGPLESNEELRASLWARKVVEHALRE